MRLSKRYQQLIEEWVREILQKYPQVRYEGVERAPEGGVAIKLRGPEDILALVIHEYASKKIEAALKYRCDILFAPHCEPPLDPNWPDWEIWQWKDETVEQSNERGQKSGDRR